MVSEKEEPETDWGSPQESDPPTSPEEPKHETSQSLFNDAANQSFTYSAEEMGVSLASLQSQSIGSNNFKGVQFELQEVVAELVEAESNNESAGSIDWEQIGRDGRNSFTKSTLTLYNLCWWLFKWPILLISYLLGALGCKRLLGLDEPDVAPGPLAVQAAPAVQGATLATATAVAMAAGIAITAAVVATRTPGAIPPADIYSRPFCNSSSADDYEVKTGITRIVVQNVTPEEVNANKDNLEEAFRDIFNNQTDGCDDEYDRFMLGNELLEAENITAGDIPLTLTIWESNVSCNGCPDNNPLFDEGPTRGPPNEANDDTEINLRFHDLVTRMSPEIAATIDDTSKKVDGPTLTHPQQSTPKTRNTPIVYIDAVDPNNPDVIVESHGIMPDGMIDSQGTMPEKMEVPSKAIPPITSNIPENSGRGNETAPNDQETSVATHEDQPPATTANISAPSTPNLNNSQDNQAPSTKDRDDNQAPSASNGNHENNPSSTPTTSNNPGNQAPSTSNDNSTEAPSITNDNNQAPSTANASSQAPASQNNNYTSPTDASGSTPSSTTAFPSNQMGNIPLSPAASTNVAPGENQQSPTVQSGFGSPPGPDMTTNVPAAAIPTIGGPPSGSTGPIEVSILATNRPTIILPSAPATPTGIEKQTLSPSAVEILKSFSNNNGNAPTVLPPIPGTATPQPTLTPTVESTLAPSPQPTYEPTQLPSPPLNQPMNQPRSVHKNQQMIPQAE
ncbi:hypothetical protein SEMRO_297_G110970.1 [Seminavis robusta]|uniref:Uncharacterized protein n=1 Tax=Seminavis robusta TaxID=568900 RepID=A0A9N8HCD5_9STRA|nr:hypothetical protein SEMRO_297_G110970.1 [Seminavis robusta]|eukprot:Sro297_g110970.1 n/a (734) ;mRNA; f:70444-72733